MSARVIVAGYPKSGNTWLSRLLGDALDCSIRGAHGAVPIAAYERGGEGEVIQLHLLPVKSDAAFISDPRTLNPNRHTGEIVIHVIRDPRDVAVAIDAYWGIGNLQRTIREVMACGAHPLWGCGWPEWVAAWRHTDLPHIETRYEWLHENTLIELRRLMNLSGLRAVNPLGEVVKRQSFDQARQYIAQHGETMPHGAGIQRVNLRRGIVGDWRTAFSAADKRAAYEVFGEWLLRLGYESDGNWAN